MPSFEPATDFNYAWTICMKIDFSCFSCFFVQHVVCTFLWPVFVFGFHCLNVVVRATTKCGCPTCHCQICKVYMCSVCNFLWEGKVAVVKGTSLFPLSVLSFPHVCVFYTLVHHFLCLHPPCLCAPPALLFSQHKCHPRGEGVLLPFGQLREAVFAPSVCPAKQTAMLLQCGQSLGSSLRPMPPSRNR